MSEKINCVRSRLILPKLRKITIFLTFLIMTVLLTMVNIKNAEAKNIFSNKQKEIVNKNTMSAVEKLALIDNYQKKYFEIVKRNDVLLFFEDETNLNNDRKELKKLFTEVKKKIKNKNYLKEYKQIEKKYSQCNCYDDETTTCINEFAENNYKEVDGLLNTVYKEVQLKISPEDFKKLSQSEKYWLKEVKAYEKTYNATEFGSLGTSTYYDYQTNMKSFRTLLLILFL